MPDAEANAHGPAPLLILGIQYQTENPVQLAAQGPTAPFILYSIYSWILSRMDRQLNSGGGAGF